MAIRVAYGSRSPTELQGESLEPRSLFRPYRIHRADGRSLDVHHPDFVARAPTGRTITVYKLDDTSEIVDLLLVAGLEVLNGQSQSEPRAPATGR